MNTSELLRQHATSYTVNKVKENRAVRKILSGCNIIEYGILEIQEEAKGELKLRANNTVKWALSVVKWMIGHPNAQTKHKEVLKEEYHSDKPALLSELFDTVVDLNCDDLVLIIEGIKSNIDEKKRTDDKMQ